MSCAPMRVLFLRHPPSLTVVILSSLSVYQQSNTSTKWGYVSHSIHAEHHYFDHMIQFVYDAMNSYSYRDALTKLQGQCLK